MKKSTLMAILAVTVIFVSVTAANLQLKSEYNKGHIKNAFEIRAIADFRYIKDNSDTSFLKTAKFAVKVAPSQQPGIGVYTDKETEQPFLFEVLHDTLYISSDPAYKNKPNSWRPVIIHTRQLNAMDLSNGKYQVDLADNDSFSAQLHRYASLDLKARRLARFSATASGQSALSLEVGETIDQLNLHLENVASFSGSGLDIRNRNVQLGSASSIRLSGKSIQSFGIGNGIR